MKMGNARCTAKCDYIFFDWKQNAETINFAILTFRTLFLSSQRDLPEAELRVTVYFSVPGRFLLTQVLEIECGPG
jgi:hypothetical protein